MRRAVISKATFIGARFLVDFYDLVDRWAARATEVVEDWPDDPSDAEPTLELDRYILERAKLREGNLAPTHERPSTPVTQRRRPTSLIRSRAGRRPRSPPRGRRHPCA